MPYPALSHSTEPLTTADAEALVLALPPLDEVGDALEDYPGVTAALKAIGFVGAPGVVFRLHLPEITSSALAVVGTGAAPDAAAYRDAAGAAARILTGFESLAVAAPLRPDLVSELLEGAVIGGYRFETYKSTAPKKRAEKVAVHSPEAVPAEVVTAAQTVGASLALVKDLVNTPAEWLSPTDFADFAIEVASELPIAVDVYDEERLEEEGFGGILGVGQGSDRPPRFIHIDYAPEAATRHIAIVGKGITFDTGGLSLKPAASMVGMKYDMCGAAVALSVVVAAARLGLPVRVSGWLCVADNMPSGRATRPGDVVRILDGTTVEVLNTDAEGRLVLADGLVAASRAQPDLLIDVATLTGAITVALGTRTAGVMGSDEATAAFLAAAERAGELAWRLPLPEYMNDELDSPIADLQNAKIGDPAGGSMFAGLFLQRFVGRQGDGDDAPRIPWVHLDIAGVGTNKGAPHGATDKGPTAATVRSLIELVKAEGQ